MGQTAKTLIGYGLDLATAQQVEQSGFRIPVIIEIISSDTYNVSKISKILCTK